jgi:hypothetical protein
VEAQHRSPVATCGLGEQPHEEDSATVPNTPRPDEDSALTATYGESVPLEYGGLYVDGDTLVVLFTRNLALHRSELEQRVKNVGRLRVVQSSRTEGEATAEIASIAEQLIRDPATKLDFVTGVGMSIRQGQWVTVVGIDPYTDENACAVL